ncbi:FGGY family carbohydrate kinase [Salinicola rhizosphaerae]|uniref:ATP:glycerol 3-phosphotransferase n=1 Tax=Salinicola rhizosphaerae TaxID=1443141 RepID=A0ABQ3E140_9GAMM|nr:FGGY family carbohydrate kinase [Salinicola rhizosphaerae]GHB21490.1 carbohydrate kinase [Salinicola rhizosphaerae]
MQILAIDQGTTSTRGLIADSRGHASIRCAFRHAQHRPRDGWVEHDPLELLANIEKCIQLAGPVDAIGLANQGESCLAWDALSGEPLSPVIVWQDNRTTEQIERLKMLGAGIKTREIAGLPLDPYFSASKLAWLIETLPQVAAAHRAGRLRLGTTDAFFLQRLTGRCITDVTTAARTSLMDLTTCRWDPELCDLFGVPIDTLPSIGPSAGTLGDVRGTPLGASLVDQQASLYGHGCRRPGDTKVTFGTGAFALGIAHEPLRDSDSGLISTLAWQVGSDPASHAIEGGVYDASAAVEWAKGLGLFQDYAELARFETSSAIGRELAFVPALSGLACPHWDRRAGALWLGMHGGTTRRDLCQSLLEGIALRSAEVVEAISAHLPSNQRISVDGGLARSPYFVQFFADVTQREIVTHGVDELTAYGCASLAAQGSGLGALPLSDTPRIVLPGVSMTTASAWRERFAIAVARSASWR